MSTEQKHSPTQVHFNANLPTLFVDHAIIGTRNDGMCLIRFLAGLPDGNWEQVRVMTDTKRLQLIIDVLCQASKYYPAKPAETKAAAVE